MFRGDQTRVLLIGKALTRTASVNVLDRTATAYLADGEIVVVDENDTPLTPGQTIANSRRIRVVQRSGATALTSRIVASDWIYGDNVISYSGRSYSPGQEQIYYIGYNATTGDIDATGTNDYVLRVTFKHNKDMWSQQANQRIYRHTPPTGATNGTIADSFAIQISDDSFASSEIKAERVSDGTFTVLGGASTLAVTNGSVTATASSAAHALVAGDYVRIGGAGASFPIYQVASVSGVTITLDQKYQGDTATVTNANAGEMSAQTDFGIKLTGKAQTFDVAKFGYRKVKFDVTLSEFGTTAITESQEASLGNGAYEQISELEYFTNGTHGAIDRVGDSAPAIKADAVSGETYDTIAIDYFQYADTNVVSGSKPARQHLLIALPDGTAQATDVLAQLNAWMASTPKSFSNVAV